MIVMAQEVTLKLSLMARDCAVPRLFDPVKGSTRVMIFLGGYTEKNAWVVEVAIWIEVHITHSIYTYIYIYIHISRSSPSGLV